MFGSIARNLKGFGEYLKLQNQNKEEDPLDQDKKEDEEDKEAKAEAEKIKKPKNYVFRVKNFELSLEETDHPENLNKKDELFRTPSGRKRKRQTHYQVKKSQHNLMTHISQVDESFTDFQAENKFDSNMTKLLGNIIGIPQKQKPKAQQEENKTNFIIYFDVSLYIAPPVIKRLEAMKNNKK